MQNTFKTELLKRYPANHARVTKITTAHGEIITPAFMPVATRAFVNHLTPGDLHNTRSQIILGGNTYHMLVAPGVEALESVGGMHHFMGWEGPMLTDSGGFQVFSLFKDKICKCKIKEDGAHFKHPNTGKLIHLTPTKSIQTQKSIGADIIMAFDQCTSEDVGHEEVLYVMTRTHRWLQESCAVHFQDTNSHYGLHQALFGIIQGGSFRDLREKSAEFVLAQPVDGVAIGGEAIGFDRQKTLAIIAWLQPFLPEDKTRYTMGVGLHPQDLIDVVAMGIDIFDCVAPTRNARHGTLFHGAMVEKDDWFAWESDEPRGRLSIKKSLYAKDNRPISEDCGCPTCQQFSRAYLHYLLKMNASLYYQLACVHNIFVMQWVCQVMRDKILNG